MYQCGTCNYITRNLDYWKRHFQLYPTPSHQPASTEPEGSPSSSDSEEEVLPPRRPTSKRKNRPSPREQIVDGVQSGVYLMNLRKSLISTFRSCTSSGLCSNCLHPQGKSSKNVNQKMNSILSIKGLLSR